MKTRQLGTSDLQLTVIGLGSWAIGGPWQHGWGPQDDNDSIRTIFKAVDSGINWIDTAPIYGCGHGESVIGRALKELKGNAKPLIATKCGLRWNDRREKVSCLDADSIRRECDESLRRLGVEVIDLYQLHWPQPEHQLEEAWAAMADCVRQGKVRYLGASNVNCQQLDRIRTIHPVAGIQPPYSMLRRDIEKELLDYCQRHQIGIVCYSPLQKGLLTGTFTMEKWLALPPDDNRKHDPHFIGETFKANLAKVEALRPIAARFGKTVGQMAIAWVLRHPQMTAAIVGARKPQQIDDWLAAADWTLDDQTLADIEKVLQR